MAGFNQQTLNRKLDYLIYCNLFTILFYYLILINNVIAIIILF